jgi:hypothetical protein
MSNEKDLENGDAKRERISFADGWDPDVSATVNISRSRTKLMHATER